MDHINYENDSRRIRKHELRIRKSIFPENVSDKIKRRNFLFH